MANQVSAYQVADSAEGKRGSINAWTAGGTGEHNLVDLKTGFGNYVEKDEAPIDIVKNERTYETRAIKRFYVWIGILPECIEFTESEKLTAKLNKIVAHIWAKILFGPSCYFAVVGVGLSPVLASVLGAVAFALSFIYFEKLELIFSTSIEANEVLHNEEDCKKFHEMVKMWDKNVLSVLVLAIWKTPSFLIVLPGLIKMIMDQKYVGVSIIGASLIFTIPNAVGQCYVKFSKEFIEKKNEIEIKHFFKSIEDVVLGPNESNKENISKRLRQVQFAFVSRIRKRKKTLFYHPANIVSAILGVGMNAYSICTFTFKNDLLLSFGGVVCICLTLFVLVKVILLPSGKLIAQGGQVFIKCRQSLDYLDFIQGVEERLGIRYQTFELWLNKMSAIATFHILGIPVNNETLKTLFAAMGSILSIAVAYAAREILFA